MKKHLSKVPQVEKNKVAFNYSNLILKKNIIKVSFDSIDQNEFYVFSNSIIKILSQLNHSSQSLEQICINYITCAISNDDTSEFEPSNELAPVYVHLLNTSKSFYCNANIDNPPLMITDFSLKKIMNLLGETIVGMSDYISIAIFVFSEDELHNRFKNLTKLSLRANILEKYGHNSIVYPLFNGRAKVPIILPFAEQNPRINIIDLDFFIDNVSAHLEKKPQKNRIYSLARHSQNSKLIEKPLKLYKQPKSRPKFSINKNIMSPFISSSGDSRQNSNDFIFLDNNNFDSVSFTEDDIQAIPGSKQGRLKAKPKKNEEVILLKKYYSVYDIGLERRLIPEKYIEMSMKALNEFIVKSDNVNLFDNKKKIARLNSNELKTINKSLDDIWIEVRDINDKTVYVKRKTLENKTRTCSTNDLITIDDFEGNNVFIKNTKHLLADNSNLMSKNIQSLKANNENNTSQKQFFVVRLARIEMREMSRYYSNLNQ